MKKYATISLFIFWAFTVAVLAAGLVTYDKNQSNNSNTANTSTAKITGISPKETTVTLSKTELAKHNSVTSCWLLISGKIYDVTSYLNSHPGGEAEILKTCGTDATVIYDSRDNTGTHSSGARSMLANYYIGDLNQTVITSPTNPTTPPVANPNPTLPQLKSGENEFDD